MSWSVPLPAIYFIIMLMQYQYSLYGRYASAAAGGKEGGLTVTIAVAQIAVCAAYALVLWAIRFNPLTLQRQNLPRLDRSDLLPLIMLSTLYACAHSSGHFALTVGSHAFGQVVKAAEPVFSATVSATAYGATISKWRWLCIPLIVGGVAVSTLKRDASGAYAIALDLPVLVAGCVCNAFAAFRNCESKRMMRGGLSERLGSPSNQFAVTNVLALVASLPLMLAVEGVGGATRFVELARADPTFRFHMLVSGLLLYLYNELTTLTIKRTSALTASVANTGKRAFVIVGVALATGKAVTSEEKLGATITIASVLLYSMVDDLAAKPTFVKERSRGEPGVRLQAAAKAPPKRMPPTKAPPPGMPPTGKAKVQ